MSDAAASLMGRGFYAEFLWPRQRRVLDSLRRRHPEIIRCVHMCGRTDPLFRKMAE